MKDSTRTNEAKAKTLKRKQQRADKLIASTLPPHNDEALKSLLTYIRRNSK